jgi:hypothetical protein
MKSAVYIVGGGTSLSGFDFSKLKDKDTIAINQSLYSVPWCRYFVTMDYTFLKKTQIDSFRETKCDKIFVVNLAAGYLKEINGLFIDTRNDVSYDLKDFNIVIKSYYTEGLGLNFRDFHNGMNSAFCAFQFAVLMGYQEINLLGFDFICRGRTHYHDDYSQNLCDFQRRLDMFYRYLLTALGAINRLRPDVRIYNCSEISRLKMHLSSKEI